MILYTYTHTVNKFLPIKLIIDKLLFNLQTNPTIVPQVFLFCFKYRVSYFL